MARKINIQVNTTDNTIRVTEFDDVSQDIAFEALQKLNEGISICRERADMTLQLADDTIKIVTKFGATNFFPFADVEEVAVNGTPSVLADLSELVDALKTYIFSA